jgi:uncharacterized membrane protein
VEAAQTEAHLATIDCADASDPSIASWSRQSRASCGSGSEIPQLRHVADPVASRITTVKLLGAPIAKRHRVRGPCRSRARAKTRVRRPFVPQIDEPSDDNGRRSARRSAMRCDTAMASDLLSNTTIHRSRGGARDQPRTKNTALATVTGSCRPVLTRLDVPLTALFNALGITVGGADITVLSIGPLKQGELDLQPALAR